MSSIWTTCPFVRASIPSAVTVSTLVLTPAAIVRLESSGLVRIPSWCSEAIASQASTDATSKQVRWAEDRFLCREFEIPGRTWEEWNEILGRGGEQAAVEHFQNLRSRYEVSRLAIREQAGKEFAGIDLDRLTRTRRAIEESLSSLEPLLTQEDARRASELSSQLESELKLTGLEAACLRVGFRDRERRIRLQLETLVELRSINATGAEFRQSVVKEIRSAYRTDRIPAPDALLEYEKPFSLHDALATFADRDPEFARCLKAHGVTAAGGRIRWSGDGRIASLLEEIAEVWASDVLDCLRVELQAASRMARCEREADLEEATRDAARMLRASKRWEAWTHADSDVTKVAQALRECCGAPAADRLLIAFAQAVATNCCGPSWLESRGRALLGGMTLDAEATRGITGVLDRLDATLHSARLEFADAAMRIRALTSTRGETRAAEIERIHFVSTRKIWAAHEASLRDVRLALPTGARHWFAEAERKARFAAPREFGAARISVAHGVLQEERLVERQVEE